MKRIKIKQIYLSNFRGQNIKADIDGDIIFISGRNGIGKSSIMKAFCWLVSGFTSPIENKNGNLYNNMEEQSEKSPNAEVEALIVVDNLEYRIKRTAKCKFERKRGDCKYVKSSSDEYKTFIDQIEYSVSDFNSWIERNICPTDMLTYCLNGEFFTTLAEDDKDKARKVLQNIIGEISNADFEGDYKDLFKSLERYNIDELTTQTKNKIKPINQRLEEIPTIIANKQSELSEYKQIDFDGILKEIEEKKESISAIDRVLLGAADSIKPLVEKRNKELVEIDKKRQELSTKTADYNTKQEELPNKLKRELEQVILDNKRAEKSNESQQANIKRCKNSIADLKADIERGEKYREQLITQRDEAMGMVFDATSCSYCGQELPFEKLEEAQTKFNEIKKSKINNIVGEGRSNNKKIEDAKSRIKELESVLDKESIPTPIKDTKELDFTYQGAIDTLLRYQDSEEYKKELEEIEELKSSITEIPEQNNDNLTAVKLSLMQDKEDLDRRYGLNYKVAEIETEIANLEGERRLIGADLAKLEGLLSKIKEYQQEKANLISSRVNELLDYSTIEMERTQKDGSKVASCGICNKSGVKFATLNAASRILVQVDIQAMYNRFYDVALPIWADDASLIDKSALPAYSDHQMIYILNEDSQLKIESV